MGDPLFFVKITDTLFGFDGKQVKSVYHVNCHDITKVYRKNNKHYVRLYTDQVWLDTTQRQNDIVLEWEKTNDRSNEN